MVQSNSYPKKINMIRGNLAEDHNVFAEDNEERSEWVKDIRDPPNDGYMKDQSEAVYFTGCTVAYFPGEVVTGTPPFLVMAMV